MVFLQPLALFLLQIRYVFVARLLLFLIHSHSRRFLSRITVACIQTLTVSKPLRQNHAGCVHMVKRVFPLRLLSLSQFSFGIPSSPNTAIMPTTSYKDPLTSINLILFCFCFSFLFTLVHCMFVRVFFPRQIRRIRFVLRQQIHTDKIILFEVTNIPRQNEDIRSIFFFSSSFRLENVQDEHEKKNLFEFVACIQIT